MTVLNFVLQEDLVGIVTDSVVSNPSDMKPMFFTTKVYPVPHWKGIICGTGIMNVITEWAFGSISSMLARDIVHLDTFAPAALRELFKKTTGQFGDVGTVTLYHFGYSASEERFVGFAYRSTSNFVSERLPYGIGLKPDPERAPEDVVITQFPADLADIAKLQKSKDEAKPVEKRVGIGGELFAYLMTYNSEKGVHWDVSQVDTFDDFDAAYQHAVEQLQSY